MLDGICPSSSHACHPQCVTGPRSDVLHEPLQTIPVSSSRDGDAPGVRSCCAACCWLLYLCHCCRGWDVTPVSRCRWYLGAILGCDQALASLSWLLFFSSVSKWFWFVCPWLGMVALSHCHCLHAAPQLLLWHVALELGRPGGSRPLAQDVLPVERGVPRVSGPLHSVTACSRSYVRS